MHHGTEAARAICHCKQMGSVEAVREEFLLSCDELALLKGVLVPISACRRLHDQMDAAVEAEKVRTSLAWISSHFSPGDYPLSMTRT